MKTEWLDKALLFTDGACSGNPGPGGYGAVLVLPEGHVDELGGRDASTTNNRMEMLAVIAGLRRVPENSKELWVLTDSTYVIRGITQWIWGWKKRQWKTAAGKDVQNVDLWQDLEREVLRVKKFAKLDWKYIRGHSGNPGNERCDEIAVAFSQRRSANLYSGPLLGYSVAIHDLPEDLSMPEQKERKEKKKAHSYLSYVGGKLQRHATWSECEAEVKGRPGAKFKKALSPEDEKDIVSQWGLSPEQLQKI